jgi:hypothetical protein
MTTQTRQLRRGLLPLDRLAAVRWRAEWWPLVGVLLASTLLHLLTLTRFPAPYVDDAFVTSLAWGMIQTGVPYGPLQAGVMEQYPGYWSLFSWIGTWLQSLPLRLFGLSLWAARLASLASGLVLLVALYVIGRRLGGQRAGLLTVALVSLSSTFFISSHMARPDIMVVAAGFSAVALILTDRSQGLSIRSVVAGMLVGVAFEIHPNGMVFGPIIVALFLVDHGWKVIRQPGFWCFVAGAAALLAVFVATHILPYPQTYFATAALAFGPTKTPPFLDPSQWLLSLQETAALPLAVDLRRFPLLVGAVVVLMRSRMREDKKPLIILAVLLAEMWALIPYKPAYYHILVSPALDLTVALLLTKLLARPWYGSPLAYLRTAGTWGCVLASVLVIVPSLQSDGLADHDATVAQIREVIPLGSKIMGEPKYWLGLADHPFVGWQQLTYVRRHVPGSDLAAGFRTFRPDVLIIDSRMEWHITDEPEQFQPWAQLLYLPKSEWTEYLARHATLVAAIESETSGTVRVYRLHWDE